MPGPLRRRARPSNPWAPLKFPALGAVAVAGYGILGYRLIFGWSLVDSVYMTLMTMTTVGYGEVRPLDTGGKIFTITLLFLGAALLFMALSIAASVLLEDPVRDRLRRRRLKKRIGELDDHFIVCGFGRVGRTVADALHAEGVPFVVVDRSEELTQELSDFGYLYLTGDATSREDLAEAGIASARALVSVVDDDAENIFITMTARAAAPNLWIVARASQEESIERLRTAGANRVYSPFVTAGREMAVAAINPGVVDFLEVETEGAPLRLEEVQIEVGSRHIGRALGDVKGAARALAVRRANGEVVAPPGDDLVIGEGDVLVLLGERDVLRPLERQ